MNELMNSKQWHHNARETYSAIKKTKDYRQIQEWILKKTILTEVKYNDPK